MRGRGIRLCGGGGCFRRICEETCWCDALMELDGLQ